MKLKKLHIENYKNLKNFELDFENDNGLSIIVGNNGSGKSNILEAISGIFCEWYGKVKYTFPCDYSLSYDYDGRIITLKREGKHKFFFENEVLYDDSPCLWLPSNVIALYSGEDNRLQQKFYETSANKYYKDKIDGINGSLGMLYVNKYAWSISFFIILLFAEEMDSVQNTFLEFLRSNLGIDSTNQVEKVEINFNFKNKYEENSNILLKTFISKINPKKEKTLKHTIDEWRDLISSSPLWFEANPKEIFSLLMQSYIFKEYQIIEDIEIKLAKGFSFKDFSEGEKKLILLKTCIEVMADQDSLLLLDEPDANIHEARKTSLIKLLREYYNRHIIITSHSPTVAKCAEKNQLKFLENKDGIVHVISEEKIQILKILASDIWNIVEAGVYLNSDKPLILFEGKTDIDYVTRALELLKNDHPNYKDIDVDFLSFNGTTNAFHFINDLLLLTNERKLIVFCDNDQAGKDAIREIKKLKKSFILCELYPLPEGITEKQFLLEDYFSKNKIESIITNKISTIKHPYKDLPNLSSCIKKELKENYMNYPKEDFEGFKVLLDKIYEMTKTQE